MTVSTAVAALMLLAVVAIAVRSAWSLLFRKAPVPRRRARGRRLPYQGPTDNAGQYPMPGADGIGCDSDSSGGAGG
ncbi:hypothetical protein [Nonomuraea pusilla]|uniref:Uncharacterized protein n=1 Tax=Nonomuraea pusilla TaxID=46177 RepID=A0A1H7WSV0_9ACTN|nr:hypothetical protein [Nonomuraea pusilla]SEM24640.1 hypothetical protein SAMN05660976_04581 [Nonomuraea pusilla]